MNTESSVAVVIVCALCVFILRNTLWVTLKEAWQEYKENKR